MPRTGERGLFGEHAVLPPNQIDLLYFPTTLLRFQAQWLTVTSPLTRVSCAGKYCNKLCALLTVSTGEAKESRKRTYLPPGGPAQLLTVGR